MVNPKWAGQKLAEIARFLAQIARNPALKNTLKYCVFTIIDPYEDYFLYVISVTYPSPPA
jgi:hypothetical protein